MAVHTYGLPVDLDPLLNLARTYSLFVIEDAAEAIGLVYKSQQCGSFGDISTFSFYPNKHITTGEGGMVLTDDDSLASIARELRNLCFQPEERFIHYRLGWNLRMTNIQAAIGLAQVEQLPQHLLRKVQIGEIYNDILSSLPSLQLPLKHTPYANNLYWVYGLLLPPHIDRRHFMQLLSSSGIGNRPFFAPMHMQPVFTGCSSFANKAYPVSEDLYARGLYLPSGLGHSDEDIVLSAQTFKRLYLSCL